MVTARSKYEEAWKALEAQGRAEWPGAVTATTLTKEGISLATVVRLGTLAAMEEDDEVRD